MSETPTNGHNDVLLTLLRKLQRTGASGTIFVRTQENHLGSFGLRNGAIVATVFRAMRGPKAFEKLQSIDIVSSRFDSSQVVGEGSAAPEVSTEEILTILEHSSKLKETYTIPLSAKVKSLTVINTIYVSDDIIRTLRDGAIEALGPIADILCSDLLEQHGRSVDGIQRVVAALVADFDDAGAAKEFSKRIMSLL